MENEFESTTLARNIRKIRDIRGYSQEYVAEKLTLSQSTYSKMELGKIFITEEVKEKIAGVLGVDKQILEHYNDSMIFNNCTGNVGGNNTNNGNTGNNSPYNIINPLERVRKVK